MWWVLLLIVAVPLLILAIPLLAIWTHHRYKMAELRMQRENGIGEAIKAEFASVRAEIQALRDTSTQYDLSFDASLQQLERRIGQLERANQTTRASAEEPAQNGLYYRR